jgi:hypothetical protein
LSWRATQPTLSWLAMLLSHSWQATQPLLSWQEVQLLESWLEAPHLPSHWQAGSRNNGKNI